MPKPPVNRGRGRPAAPLAQSVLLEGVEISYRVEWRPRRQHAAIQITAQRAVVVLLPAGAPAADAAVLLRAKAPWVLRHWAHPPAPPPAPVRLQEGTALLFGGAPLVVRTRPGPGWAVQPDGPQGILWVSLPAPVAPADQDRVLRPLLQHWLAAQAAQALQQQVLRWAPQVGGPMPTAVRVRDYRSRWGVARSDGLLTFNWRLVQSPPHCQAYIAVHELTHLAHPHHQPPFWAAVARVLPAYPESKRWLHEHGAELYW